MQVCDRTIRECIRLGARSVAEVGSACRAGTGCGGCQAVIEEIVCDAATGGEPVRIRPGTQPRQAF
jgi:NAD(P)H-nitrite reductase large subunit